MQETRSAPLRLVHVTTVPMTLKFLTGQAEFLRRRGFEVFAISSPGEELGEFESEERIPCFSVAMERSISPLRDVVALARLWRLLRRIRPDIIDAHTPKAGLLGVAAGWLAGVPVRIYHLHGLRFLTLRGARRQLLVATERVASALATRVLCVSPSGAALASACALAPESKLGVLLSGSINGVDVERFRPIDPAARRAARAALGIPADSRVIGFVGRLVRDKGVCELAEAWRVLREEMPDLRLVLLGVFEPQDPVPQSVVSTLLSDPRVHAVGSDWDTPKYYRAFDVVALPTYREGLPQVPLEAAAMALPVVSTRVPGCTDAILDSVTGTLVAPRDEGALMAALRAYLQDPALRERHGAAARDRVLREFQQSRVCEALHQEYVRLASGRRLVEERSVVTPLASGSASERARAPEAPSRRGLGSPSAAGAGESAAGS